jgi:hypothetical protein
MLHSTETCTDEGEQEIPDLKLPPPSLLPSPPSSPPPPPPATPSAPADAAPDAAQPAALSPDSHYTGRRAHTRCGLRLAKLRSLLAVAHFTVSSHDPTAFFCTLHNGTTEMLTIKANDMLLVASRTGSLDTMASYLCRLVHEIFGCITVTEVDPALRLVRFVLPRCPPTPLRARDLTHPTALFDTLFARKDPCARALRRPLVGHLACQLPGQASALRPRTALSLRGSVGNLDRRHLWWQHRCQGLWLRQTSDSWYPRCGWTMTADCRCEWTCYTHTLVTHSL